MNKTDNPADPFKKALTEATRARADDAELNVTFTADPSGVAGDTMRLPQVSRRMTREEIVQARGTADALAMRLRHHDAATHAKYAPAGPMAREIFEVCLATHLLGRPIPGLAVLGPEHVAVRVHRYEIDVYILRSNRAQVDVFVEGDKARVHEIGGQPGLIGAGLVVTCVGVHGVLSLGRPGNTAPVSYAATMACTRSRSLATQPLRFIRDTLRARCFASRCVF